MIEFNLKTKLKFGPGEGLNLGKYLKEMGFKRIAVIVDSKVYQTDYLRAIIDNLARENFEGIKIWEYNFKAEPDYDSLDRVKIDFMDEVGQPIVDCFVGIGGGSVIDFSKGLATLVVNPFESRKYRGFPQDINPSLPTIALPTTAGTGSEVTYNAVFIDWKDNKKLGINTMHNFPVLAVLDPKLTLTCLESITVSAGMDALTHILESYISLKANPLNRFFAKEAFRLVFNSLFKVLDEPDNLEIRGNIQLGAYLAGISLMNSSPGIAGAMSYPLGVHFKVPHGIAGAVFLPYITEYNAKSGFDYSELYDFIENTNKDLSKEEKSRLFSQKMFELCEKLKVPSDLKAFGVNEENIDKLLNDVEGLKGAFDFNPIPFSVEEGRILLTKLIK